MNEVVSEILCANLCLLLKQIFFCDVLIIYSVTLEVLHSERKFVILNKKQLQELRKK